MKNNILLITAVSLFLSFANTYVNADTYYRLIKKGNRYYKNELYQDALKYYLKGIEKNKKAYEPYFNAGTAYYKTEDYIKSIEVFSQSVNLIDKDDVKSQIYYNIGNSYYKLENYHKAIESYTKGLELNPSDFNMKNNLELALKMVKENSKKQKDQQNKNEKDNIPNKNNTEKSEDSKQEEPSIKEKSEEQKKDFSLEEAERLLNSVNRDQTETIKNIIKQKASRVKNEKDW